MMAAVRESTDSGAAKLEMAAISEHSHSGSLYDTRLPFSFKQYPYQRLQKFQGALCTHGKSSQGEGSGVQHSLLQLELQPMQYICNSIAKLAPYESDRFTAVYLKKHERGHKTSLSTGNIESHCMSTPLLAAVCGHDAEQDAVSFALIDGVLQINFEAVGGWHECILGAAFELWRQCNI